MILTIREGGGTSQFLFDGGGASLTQVSRGFHGSFRAKHGWYQSHYVDFNVRHHVNRYRCQSLFLLSMVTSTGIDLRGVAVEGSSRYVHLYTRCHTSQLIQLISVGRYVHRF